MEKLSSPRYVDPLAPWRGVVAAVIIRALRDTQLKNQGIASEANNWLKSRDAAALLEAIGIRPKVLENLDITRLNLGIRANHPNRARCSNPSRSTLWQWAQEDGRGAFV